MSQSQNLLFSSNPTTVLKETFLNPQTNQEEAWCKSWLNSFLEAQSLTYGSAVLIVAVNLVFRRLLKPVVKFEHEWYVHVLLCPANLLRAHCAPEILGVQSHCKTQTALPSFAAVDVPWLNNNRSKTGEILSRATKLFFLQFLNTAVLVLIVNAQIQTTWSFLQEGQYNDFTVQWYLNVGSSITLTMIAYVFTPHISPCVSMLSKRFRYAPHHVLLRLSHTTSNRSLNKAPYERHQMKSNRVWCGRAYLRG